MNNVVIISGFLYNLSDNIVPFLNPSVNVFIHTWNTKDNKRWINKVNRYKKYCQNITIEVEEPKYSRKLHSYFYSTWKSVSLIDDISKYDRVIKFKPNTEGDITYKGDLDYYFTKGYLQSYPLLEGVSKEDCIYGSIYYQTMDERIFTGYPKSVKKIFNSDYKVFHNNMIELDEKLLKEYGEKYEGSIFWKNWIENKGVKLIQDIDLKIPNNVRK